MPHYPQIFGPLPRPGDIDRGEIRLHSDDQDAIRCQDINTMPSCSYYIALTRDLESIRYIIDREIDGTAIRQGGAGFIEVVGIDRPLVGFIISNVRDMINAGVNDSYARTGVRKIECLAVGRKSNAVRFVETVLDNGHETRDGVKAVHRRVDLRSFGIDVTWPTVICMEDSQRHFQVRFVLQGKDYCHQ